VANIKFALTKASLANPHLCGADLVPETIKANCWQSIEDLYKSSPEVCELVKTGKLKVVAAIYNISTGKVGWLGTHPDQSKLLASLESSEKKETVATETTKAKEKVAAETDKGKEKVVARAEEPKKEEHK
jgi:carbonic anhydrase